MMKKLIKTLSDMRGVSGFEYLMTDKIKEIFEPYCDEVYTDTLGNVTALKKSNNPEAVRVMIEAHCDEIGLMVTSITDEGFLTFANIGGVDNRILPALEVTVHGKSDIWGVIGTKPPHLREEGKTSKLNDMFIDTGLDIDKVKEIVSIGDTITIAQSVGKLGKKQWSGKSLDDRACVAVLVDVMKRLSQKQLNTDVYAVCTVQEEVGARGARTAAYRINPDFAIAMDVTHAVTPDNSDNAFEIGGGAVIATGPNLHPRLTQKLFQTADKCSVKTQIEAEGSDTGTDAWEIQTAREGIPTALISIPLKYMHTSVETLAISDVKDCAKLIEALILDMEEEDISWLRL